MKKYGSLVLVLLLLPVCLAGCGAPTVRGFTLNDAPQVLDLSAVLPASFDHIDAASEQLSNSDLGLGPEFSEVEVFLREDPLQLILTYLIIIESQVERATSDALVNDDAQIGSMVQEGIRAGAAEEGIYDISLADIQVTHPNVGDLAVLGTGTMSAYGASIGYDILIFRQDKTYVFIASMYLPGGEKVSLVPAAGVIANRISSF